MALRYLPDHSGLVEVVHSDTAVRAGEESEEGVELVDAGETGHSLAVLHGDHLTELVVRGLPLTVRQLEAVYGELVPAGGEEDVVHVEEPRHVDRLREQTRTVSRPPCRPVVLLTLSSLPAVDLHEDSPGPPVPDLDLSVLTGSDQPAAGPGPVQAGEGGGVTQQGLALSSQ